MFSEEFARWLIGGLMSAGFIGALIALYKAKPERNAVVATGAEQTVVTMGRLNDKLEASATRADERAAAAEIRAEKEHTRRLAVEEELEALQRDFAELQDQFAELQRRFEHVLARSRGEHEEGQT